MSASERPRRLLHQEAASFTSFTSTTFGIFSEGATPRSKESSSDKSSLANIRSICWVASTMPAFHRFA